MLETFLPMAKNVLIFIALAIPGYILVKVRLMKSEHSAVLSKLLMYVGMPFLILSGTLGVNLTGQTGINLLLVAIIGTALTFLLFFISKFLVFSKKDESVDLLKRKKLDGMERFCSIFSNNGFLGLPLAAAVFGTNTTIFAYIVVLNIITNTLMYTVGVYLVSGDVKSIKISKVLFNPVLISFILGIIINITGIFKGFPEAITYADYFKNIVTPISMVILGMKMGEIKFSEMLKSPRVYFVSVKKLILVPVLAVAITVALVKLFALDADMIMASFIGFSMPTAALAPVFADKYDGDGLGATIYTLGNTLLSLLTIPLLYLLLCAIV